MSLDRWMEEEEKEFVSSTLLYNLYDKAKQYTKSFQKILNEEKNLIDEIYWNARDDVKKAKIRKFSEKIVAIDSSFEPIPMSLSIGKIAPIVIAYIIYPTNIKPEISVILSIPEELEEVSDISFMAKINELIVMKNVLEKIDVKDNIYAIIRDGEFPLNEIFFKPYYAKEREELMKILGKTYNLAKNKGIGLAGIVKRISTRHIAYKYLSKEEFKKICRKKYTLLNDYILADIILERGEYLLLGDYHDIIRYFELINPKNKTNLKKVKENIDEILPEVWNTNIVLYKPYSNMETPVKLLSYRLNIEKILEICISSTPDYPPYPDFMNIVDKVSMEYSRELKINDLFWLMLRKAFQEEEISILEIAGKTKNILKFSNIQKLELINRRLTRFIK